MKRTTVEKVPKERTTVESNWSSEIYTVHPEIGFNHKNKIRFLFYTFFIRFANVHKSGIKRAARINDLELWRRFPKGEYRKENHERGTSKEEPRKKNQFRSQIEDGGAFTNLSMIYRRQYRWSVEEVHEEVGKQEYQTESNTLRVSIQLESILQLNPWIQKNGKTNARKQRIKTLTFAKWVEPWHWPG